MGKFVSDPAIVLPGKRFTHMICEELNTLILLKCCKNRNFKEAYFLVVNSIST